ncbi:hypothetical protein C0J52_03430 [Blattella germanica]|nr:hypothetical protein C0J52_03430 [Blattella germanica]
MVGRCMFLVFLFRMSLGAPTSQLILDLGYDYDNNTQWWPGMQKFDIFERTRIKNVYGIIPWFAVNTFKTAEHVGTHVDAPFHFDENGWKLGDIPLERFYSPGLLIDVSNEVKDNFDFEFEPRHIQSWEAKHGRIPNNTVVLIRFGWSKKHYSNHDDYYGINKTTTPLNFPAAAQVFVSRGVYGVGLDTPSLDPGKNAAFEAHNVLLRARIFGIENLNLASQQIPVKDFMLHVMPMKITEGTGAPARVMAFINSQENKGFPFLNIISQLWK